jgi:hypothetical protein
MACQQNLVLTIPQPTYNLNINSSPKLDIYVNRDDKGIDCDFFVTFSKGSSANYNRKLYYNNSSLDFQLASDPQFNNVLMDFPELNNENSALVSKFHGNEDKKKLSYRAKLTLPSLVHPRGNYADTFALSLYKGKINGAHTLQCTRNVFFYYGILTSLSLSLVGSGAPYDPNDTGQSINFGTLEQGERESFDLVVVSNSAYQVRFSSQNGGRLKHQTNNSYIDYMTQINNSQVSLAGSVIAASDSGNTPNEGRRFPIRFTIGNVAGKAAGQYQDMITVTVTANN